MDLVAKQQGLVSRQRLFAMLGSSAEMGEVAYAKLISQPSQAAAMAPTVSAFVKDRRQDHLDVLLQEMLGERATPELVRSGSRHAVVVQLRREFIGQAKARGYKAWEIAKVLNVSERCVRGYWHELAAAVPGTISEPVF